MQNNQPKQPAPAPIKVKSKGKKVKQYDPMTGKKVK